MTHHTKPLTSASSRATAVVIVTCPRPGGVRYLDATASGLTSNGGIDCTLRLVVCDGPLENVPSGWSLQGHSGPPQGSRLTMWRAFRLACDAGVERLIYCEDDIVVCRNAVRRIHETRVSDQASFVDFHDVIRLRRRSHAGLYMMPLTRLAPYRGTQCMLFPRRTLEWLVQHDPFSVVPRGLPNCADLALGALLARSPWPRYQAHLPCLVRHVGDVSAAHPGMSLTPQRLPSHYAGDSSDALAIG